MNPATRWSDSPGYARYVGRVGGLAVALGVGMAVATSPGVAWADGETEPDHVDTTHAVTQTDPADTAKPKIADHSSNPADQISAIARNIVSRVTATGGALTSRRALRSHALELAPTRKPQTFSLPTAKPKDPVPQPFSEPDSPAKTIRRISVATPALPTPPEPPTPPTDFTPQRAITIDQTDNQPVAPAPLPVRRPSIAAFRVLPATIISTATQVAKAVVSALAPPAPGAPPESPLAWTVLSIVRREFSNQKPSFSNTVSEPDTTGKITVTLSETDADGDRLTYSAVRGQKGDVTLNPDGHSFTYTPDPGQVGTDTITVTASDATNPHIHGLPGLINALSFGMLGNAGHTSDPVPITVKLNTPPTLTAASGTPDADGKVTITGKISDADDNPLTLTTSQPADAKGSVSTPTVDPVTGDYTITYTPTDAARHNASADNASAPDTSDTVTVSVNDGHGGTTTMPVTVTIKPKNTAPEEVAKPVLSTPDQYGAETGTFNVKDAEHDQLTYTLNTGPAKGGTVVITGNTFTYTPAPEARLNAAATTATAADKADSFSVVADDGHGGHTIVTVPVTIKPADTITGVNTPIGVGTTHDGKLLIVAQNGPSASIAIVDLDPSSPTYNTVIKTLPVPNATGNLPYAISVSPDDRRAYVTSFGGQLSVVDLDQLSITDNVPAGKAALGNATSADGRLLYVTNASTPSGVGGSVQVINTDPNSDDFGEVVDTFTVPGGARGIVLSPDGKTGYIAAGGGTLVAINTDTNSVNYGKTTNLNVDGGNLLWDVDLTPDGNRAYVTSSGGNHVVVVNTDQTSPDYGKAIATIPAGAKAFAIDVAPDGKRAYVTTIDNHVLIIDTDPTSPTYNTVVKTLDVPTAEGGIVVSPDGKNAYVTDVSGNKVRVIPLPLT